MPKGLIFFCCACCILLLTIINLSIGPIISKKVQANFESSWGTLNCESYKDNYKEIKKTISGDDLKYGAKWDLDECQRKKGMHDMEYTAFIFDIAIGIVCGILGLLHFMEVQKPFVPKTGLIGLICGIIGFILTFVYIIFNGLIYTKLDTKVLKRDGDNAYAKRDGNSNNYKCIYYNEKNPHKVFATISDFGKKQYNYDNKLYKKLISGDCTNSGFEGICRNGQEFFAYGSNTCEYIYSEPETGITYKDISDRFLTTFILSLFVCLANIGLAVFGFLLFNTGTF